MSWIVVENRLPEFGKWVWAIDAKYWDNVSVPCSIMRVEDDSATDGWKYIFADKMLILITHWMEIPELLKR